MGNVTVDLVVCFGVVYCYVGYIYDETSTVYFVGIGGIWSFCNI